MTNTNSVEIKFETPVCVDGYDEASPHSGTIEHGHPETCHRCGGGVCGDSDWRIVVRISRHPLDADRAAYLRRAYGNDVRVVAVDIPYGDDPVAAVHALVKRVGGEVSGNVVAVEAQAPFPVTIKLVNQRRNLGVALIRAQFERDEGGKAVVVGKDKSGRDLLKFSHYEELERFELQTRRLGE